MRLRLAMDVVVWENSVERQRGGTQMASDWASETAKKLRRQIDEKRQSEELRLHDRKLLEEQGPKLWIKLVSLIKVKCDSLNRELERDVAFYDTPSSSKLKVTLDVPGFSRRELSSSFAVTSAEDALTWSTSTLTRDMVQTGQYELAIEAGQVVLKRGPIDVDSPQTIAETMMNALCERIDD